MAKTSLFDETKSKPSSPGMFNGSWAWGFCFGWLGIILAFICITINGNFPLIVFLLLLTFLIIVNLIKVSSSLSNSTYGKAGLFSVIVSVVQLVILLFLKYKK